MKKVLIVSLAICLILLGFGSINSLQVASAQELPENLEDFKNLGQRILDSILEAIKRAWEEAMGIWKKIWIWIVEIFESYIFPFLKFIWQKIWNFFLKIINLILENIRQKV